MDKISSLIAIGIADDEREEEAQQVTRESKVSVCSFTIAHSIINTCLPSKCFVTDLVFQIRLRNYAIIRYCTHVEYCTNAR
jgi:hypothetical protein